MKGYEMIDIDTEELIGMTEAMKRMKVASRSTIYNQSKKGVRGVILETVMIGGRDKTSVEAIARFIDRLTRLRNGEHREEVKYTTKKREKEKAAAKQFIQELLFGGKKSSNNSNAKGKRTGENADS
jgi:hypothetical protein